ncbi:Zinc-type alcohol dehydrogenase-like protein C2E1P3.01 [Leucoagaricus sp. SymC.cos]|nr:Zinc-type alcohol dehydrogenase-like protein C2E1P3.01 [Leucoagaricus sp. SymC.cos]
MSKITVPSKQTALFLDGLQGNLTLGATNILTPGPGQLLLKVKATALNPVDWKSQKHGILYNTFPAILGTDAAGDVVAIGEGVTKFKIGDQVFCQGRFTKEYATFQEYTLADEWHLAKIPTNISYDQAATIPLCLATAFVGMYNVIPYGIGLVNPTTPTGQGHYKGIPFVVLGGASSVGQFAIQLAKLSGFSPIITTASLKHTSFLQSLGATYVLDRNTPTSALKSQIAEITDNKSIQYIYDSISSSETQKTGIEILSPGGNLIVVSSPSVTSQDKRVTYVFALRSLDQNVELIKGVYAVLEEWLEKGVIQPNKVDLLPGGLAGIVEGLRKMEQNQVSGVKLVVRPEETPENAK